MEKENQIYSSTGELGVRRRQFDRIYVNANHYSDNFREVSHNFRRVARIVEGQGRINRGVLRGVVSDGVIEQVMGSDIAQNVEVALSLREFGQGNSWLLYLAHNRSDRSTITSVDAMVAETTAYRNSTFPMRRLSRLMDEGFEFHHELDPSFVDQIQGMWGETFGWNREEVIALRTRLENSRNGKPSERSVWFSGITHQRQVVSIAMAERLAIPCQEGDMDLVESTEWVTHPDYRGRGLMAGTIYYLGVQVASDFQKMDRIPLVYAECNFQSRSDHAGYAAGFRIPERRIHGRVVPQILQQNVGVGDGQTVEEGKLRDFTFMYLPIGVMDAFYFQRERQ